MLTLASKANNTKNVIALVSDDAVMRTIHHLVDICLQFQLYLLLFGHIVGGSDEAFMSESRGKNVVRDSNMTENN